MDISRLEWPRREEIERDLLPLIKPQPKTQEEREILLVGLLSLVRKAAAQPDPGRGGWALQAVLGAVADERNRAIRALRILEESMAPEAKEAATLLRELADRLAPTRPRGRPKHTKKAAVVDLCREFLEANERNAGIANDTGGAATLAAAVWEFLSWSARTMEGDGTTPDAMSRLSKRRNKDKKEPKDG